MNARAKPLLHSADVGSAETKPDRRRAERVEVNDEFRGAGTMYVGDLSLRGAFLHCARCLPIGTELLVRFTVVLGDPFVLKAYGRVVRHQTDPTGMGIEFTNLDRETSLMLSEVVSRCRPMDSGPPVPVEYEASPTAPQEPG